MSIAVTGFCCGDCALDDATANPNPSPMAVEDLQMFMHVPPLLWVLDLVGWIALVPSLTVSNP